MLGLVAFAAFSGCGFAPGERDLPEVPTGQPTASAGEATPIEIAPTSTPVPTPTPTPTPTHDPPTAMPAVSTPVVLAATVTAEGCYDRGCGGRIRDPNDGNVDIYLLVEPPDDPADAARAVAETLCELGGWFTPSGEIRVMKVDYTLKQLKNWYSRLRDHVWEIEGLYPGGISERSNRIRFDVLTELGKSRLEENIFAAEIPLEAVLIDVREQVGPDRPRANRSGNGIELSGEFAPEATSGHPVEFTVLLTNTTDEVMKIEHGSDWAADIVVLDTVGRQVWRYQPPVIVDTGGSSEMLPGKTVAFPVRWPGLNDDGLVVPPGLYVVRGFVHFSFDNSLTGGFCAGRDFSSVPEEIVLIGG